MRIKSHTLILSSTLVGLALVSMVVFAARNWNAKPADVGTIAASGGGASNGTSSSASTPAAWGFTLDLPDGWIVTTPKDAKRSDDGERTDGWVASGVPTDAFGADLNVSTIAVTDVAKEGRSFTQVANAYVWTDEDVQKIVAFMKAEAGDLFPDFSASDVLIESSADSVGGFAAIRATQQCLKPCYIEGGAATTVRYMIDAPDLVYLLDVSVGTSPNAADLLNAADAVVRTFKLK